MKSIRTVIAVAVTASALFPGAILAKPGGETPPTVDVNVVNTPLEVNVANTSRELVQARASEFSQTGASSCQPLVYEVPAGKRLIIEWAAFDTRIIPPGTSGVDARVFIFHKYDENLFQTSVGQTTNNGVGINSRDTFAGPVNLYAQSESEVSCGWSVPDFENLDFCTCTITGYLEDEPE